MLTDGIWEGIGKKEDKGRHMTLFLLAQGAQEIVKWIVLLQKEFCFQFYLFPIAAQGRRAKSACLVSRVLD